MSTTEIIRFLKDPECREGLSAEQQAAAPLSPAGMIGLEDAELET